MHVKDEDRSLPVMYSISLALECFLSNYPQKILLHAINDSMFYGMSPPSVLRSEKFLFQDTIYR